MLRSLDRQPGVLVRLRKNSSGNTLAMAGAALVPIAGIIGSGLDLSRAYMAQAKMQNACDSAALAARRTMAGNNWTSNAEDEGERFFDFNFPSDTMRAQNMVRTVSQNISDPTQVRVSASADIPTTVMSLFGRETIPIAVSCTADEDYGNNDIMVVLDVTGSMNDCPGGGNCNGNSNSKIARLRTGAVGLYRALQGASNTRTRYGFMPYSVTVNVARDLNTGWVRNPASYQQCQSYNNNGSCRTSSLVSVNHSNSWITNTWRGGGSYTSQTGNGCVEERASIGQSGSPVRILTSVSQADVDTVSTSTTAYKWTPYDTSAVTAESGTACPRPARPLAQYSSESSYSSMVNTVTQGVGGNTYHDTGILWATRYLSRTGMFASNNPEEYNGVPVTRHIVFLTDGLMQPSSTVYSAFGVDSFDNRLQGSGSLTNRHIAHFQSACNRAKSMGITIWVIALDVTDTSAIEPCATSSGHFYVSNGSDLEQIFTQIGQGIGRLRLTR
ncbi:TadE/TadG family type IV pilus assembly protein [Parasphingopyxis marina]|uniref:Tad domain-containing protein n=1 Tax=Parasphingopyxis marina TaxID=2761622 RepID=A0A842HY49_9SPHN|nr:TadE/TadG family type IV pilus assembly protein [Parasphingopyxis marina]MBC2777775.1 Tad domain-containing protein [Parasphingopyxis marina]